MHRTAGRDISASAKEPAEDCMYAGSSVRQFTRTAPGPVSHWDLGNFADPSTLLPKSARRNANAIMPSKRRATSLLTCYKLARERGAYGAGVGIAAGHGHSDRVAGLPCARSRVAGRRCQDGRSGARETLQREKWKTLGAPFQAAGAGGRP